MSTRNRTTRIVTSWSACVVALAALNPVRALADESAVPADASAIGDGPAQARAQLQAEADAILAKLATRPWQIIHECYDEDNWELFVMNADGSGSRNLTNTKDVHELYPQASPDGTKICFLADVQRGGDTIRSVYYMNADGTDRKLVAEKARQPCWSPDSKSIAFVKQEFRRFRIADYASKGLFFYDLETGKTRQHPNDRIEHLYNLTWSQDGNWIVTTVHGGLGFDHAIVAIEVDGRRIVKLPITGCRPCLSDDGARLTWSPGDHEVATAELTYSAEGPRLFDQVPVDRRTAMHLYHPDFSPDGKWVTYSVGPGGRMPVAGPGTHSDVAEMVGVRGPWNVHIRRADGSGPSIPLTTNASRSNKESEWIVRTNDGP